jgi:acyl-CoA synthetase (AMP-forming)/AMP-acid ligase II
MSAQGRRSRRVLRRALGTSALPAVRPDRSLRARALARRWGFTPAGAYALAAIRYPDRIAIVDDLGSLTFAEVDRRTGALARALGESAIDHRDTVAIMCANHRGFIEATVACSKLGASIVYLDPAAPAWALADTVEREDPKALIYDDEFSAVTRAVASGRQQYLAFGESEHGPRYPLLDELIADGVAGTLPSPTRRHESHVMLAPREPTDGHGSRRTLPSSLQIPGAAMSRIPLRRREATMIAAPMFTPWGFLHLTLALRLASTVVLCRRLDPFDVLATADEHRVTALAVLPEMLEAIVRLPDSTIACYPNEALRVLALPGTGLPSDVALPAIERFGDVLYNLRGPSVVRLTEAWAREVPVADRGRIADLALGVTT